MRKLLRWTCKWLGMRTCYHVAATFNASGGGMAVISLTVSVHPWLNADNYNDLREFMQSDDGSKGAPVSITSITRLGP